MKVFLTFTCCFLPLFLLSGCKKGGSTQESGSASSSNPAPAPTSSAPAPASDSANPAAEASAKMAAADWAMKQNEIKSDPNGQWAVQATASSSYNDAEGTAGWSANQATG